MAKRRRVSRSLPLEWVAVVVATTNDTVATKEIDLDLLPDEIAEIHKIDTTIKGYLASAVIDETVYKCYISMDPDADTAPFDAADYKAVQDLETIHHHILGLQADYAEATESGGWAIVNTSNKITDFPEKYPVLVGTNMNFVVEGDDAEPGQFIAKVFFKRRPATASELNQILLKRR